MRVSILTLFLGIGWWNLTMAQDDLGKFSNYNINDGLSQSTVTQVFQDKKGFIWLGTSDGLNRFDGKKFKVFKNKHLDKYSLSDSWILRILFEDSENNLWIITSDRTINKFNLKTNKVTRFIPNDKDSSALPSFQWISAYAEDSLKNIWFVTNKGIFKFCYPDFKVKSYCNQLKMEFNNKGQRIWGIKDNNGNMWFGSEQGLCRYDYITDKLIHYSTKGKGLKGLPAGTIIAPLKDNQKQFWVLSSQGLCKYNHSRDDFSLFPFPDGFFKESDLKVTTLLGDKNGCLWIGTYNGLIKYNINRNRYELYKNDPKNKSGLSNSIITKVFESANGNIWAGTTAGLNLYISATNTFKQVKNPNEKAELNIFEICQLNNGELWTFSRIDQDGGGYLFRVNQSKCLLENIYSRKYDVKSLASSTVFVPNTDRSGNLWLGTFGSGVIKYSPRVSNFIHYRNVNGNPEGLSSIWGFGEDRSGNIWIAAYDQGFARFDTANHTFNAYQPKIVYKGQQINYSVMSVCPDNTGKVWVATMGAGLLCFDPVSEKILDFPKKLNINYSFGDNIRLMRISPNGKLFICYANLGMDIFDPNTGVIERFINNPKDSNSLPNNSVWYVITDRQQNLWIAVNGFISYYNTKTKKIKNYIAGVNSSCGFPADKALSILESSNGVVWFGTSGGGLCYFDPKTDSFITFTEDNGLVNGVVYGITEDTDGNLWLSTNRGLSKFNPKTKVFKNYDESAGLQSNEFNAGAFFKSHKNRMYFGGINGFNEFNPSAITADTITPITVLTGFQVNNRDIPVNEPLNKSKLSEQTKLLADTFGYYLPMNITYIKSLTLPYKVKMFNIEFAALLFNSPDKCTFRYKMEGFDEDWNYSGTRNYATYTNLPHGKFLFKVQSSNPDGVWSKDYADIEIIIVPPFWKTWWFIVLFVILIIVLVRFYIYNRERNLRKSKILLEERVKQRTKQIEEKNEELSLRNYEISKQKEEIDFQAKQLKKELANHNQTSEIALLRSQINPHFLFNTLNNIYSLIYQKSDDAPLAVMKLSEIMRYMLYDANTDKVPLEKEINYLKSFIELQALRLKNRDCVEFLITGNIYGKMIAPMLFIPFVENAFKHGNKKSDNPCIIINLAVNGQHIIFDIENQYQKNDPINKDQTGGIGLANVRRRLELLHPHTHKLVVNDTEGVFHVILDLTLHDN
jgi:ligand-binding sensor domain-containing protein